MRPADFTLGALVVLALVALFGGWLWTRADLRKRSADRLERKS
jgi:hypothetical protein